MAHPLLATARAEGGTKIATGTGMAVAAGVHTGEAVTAAEGMEEEGGATAAAGEGVGRVTTVPADPSRRISRVEGSLPRVMEFS